MSILNKEWERIQERAFTKWVNSHLKRRGMPIEDISTDFIDGVKLINLYEAISEESLGKHYKEPKLKFHQIANLNTVVDKINGFVSSAGIKVQFSAEQIYEGDKRQILGMIWCLIHKFEIQNISEDELSAKEGLLLWCQKKTAGYSDVNVENFHNSWVDGLAFCALIHHHRPDLLDFHSLSKESKKENLELAFEVAERDLDIPQLLEADDLLDVARPDEKVVMTYVAYYWKKFASSQKSQKAANVIGKNINRQKELNEIQSDYEKRAQALVEVIAVKQESLNDISAEHFGNSLEPVSQRNVAFKEYKNTERPQHLAEKLNLEVLLSNLRSQQKNAGLPVYTPPEELSTETIDGKWTELNNAQEAYEKALNERVSLMKRLEIQLNRFHSRSAQVQKWLETKGAVLSAEDVATYTTVAALQNRIKQTEAFEHEIKSVGGNLEQTKQIGQELIDNQHASAEEVSSTIEQLGVEHAKIEEQSATLKTNLEEALKKLEELIEKLLQYAKVADVISLAVVDASAVAKSEIPPLNPNDVETFQQNLAKATSDLNTNEENLPRLSELKEEIVAADGETSTFSPHDADDLKQRFDETKETLAQRHVELAEALKVDYETRAKALSDWTVEKQQLYSDTTNLGNSVEAVLPLNDAFKQHKHTDKPNEESTKKELAAMLELLKQEVTDYDSADLSTESLEEKWVALNAAEDSYDDVLRARISLMKKLEVTLNKARGKSTTLQNWQAGKIELFDGEDVATYDSVSKIQARLKALETFADEFELQKTNLKQVEELASELQQNEHASSEEVATTVTGLQEQEQQLSEKFASFQAQLTEKLADAQSLISQGLEFSKLAEQVNLVLEDAALTLIEPVQASSVADVDSYDAALTKVSGDIEGQAPSLEELSSLSQQITEANVSVSEYSSHSLESLQERYESTKQSVEQRNGELAEERTKQESIANLLKEYSEECATYSNWISEQKDAISAEQEGDLEAQLVAAQKLEEEITSASTEKLSNIEQLYKKLDEADVAEQAEMSVQALHTLHDQLKGVCKNRIDTISQQILAEKAANVSEEQIEEFKKTFGHFDKDKSGALSKLEFKACLASLGEDVSDEEFEKTFALLDTSGDGQIGFDEFLQWISATKREGTGHDDVLKAFEVLSEGKDFVTEAQLRSSGMASEEVDYLLEKMPQKDDGYDFRSYLAAQYGQE